MASTWIYVGLALLLCLGHSAWAAPSLSDLEQFGELERTLKELATSVLAMSGAVANTGAAGSADFGVADDEMDLMDSTDPLRWSN